jgi:hypothetical protein
VYEIALIVQIEFAECIDITVYEGN